MKKKIETRKPFGNFPQYFNTSKAVELEDAVAIWKSLPKILLWASTILYSSIKQEYMINKLFSPCKQRSEIIFPSTYFWRHILEIFRYNLNHTLFVKYWYIRVRFKLRMTFICSLGIYDLKQKWCNFKKISYTFKMEVFKREKNLFRSKN